MRIIWDGLFNQQGSLGLVSYHTCKALENADHDVRVAAWRQSDPAAVQEFQRHEGAPADVAIRFCDPNSANLLSHYADCPRRIAYCYFDQGILTAGQLNALNKLDAEVWVPSAFTRQILIHQGAQCPIWVVPHGVEVPASPPAKSDLKKLTFVYAGANGYRKGTDLLLAAFRQAFVPEEPVELVFKHGGGPGLNFPEPNIRAIAGKLERTDLFNMLGKAHYFVATPRMESFGMIGLEAAAVGTPMIYPWHSAYAAYGNTMPHALPLLQGQWVTGVDGGAAARHWETDVSELAQLLRWIFTTDLQHTINEQAVQDFAAQWSWARTAQRIEEILTSDCCG